PGAAWARAVLRSAPSLPSVMRAPIQTWMHRLPAPPQPCSEPPMSTKPAPDLRHPADRHDVIRVKGARENNLKDVSVELPKRRLTVFTGVSGSGKSSLVFGTIAAESQRLINETYSAFVQGFMPSLARPEVDVL